MSARAPGPKMTTAQYVALAILCSEPTRGFDADEIARRAGGVARGGVSRTMSSLVRRGFAGRFVGGVGPVRVHWQATERGVDVDRRPR